MLLIKQLNYFQFLRFHTYISSSIQTLTILCAAIIIYFQFHSQSRAWLQNICNMQHTTLQCAVWIAAAYKQVFFSSYNVHTPLLMLSTHAHIIISIIFRGFLLFAFSTQVIAFDLLWSKIAHTTEINFFFVCVQLTK